MSFSEFIQKNKFLIIGSIGVSITALSAYYYLNQLESSSSPSSSNDQPSKKSKKSKKKKSTKSNTTTVESKKSYPIDSDNSPSLTDSFISSLDDEQKEKISLDLKQDGNEFFKNKDFEKAIEFYTAALKLKQDAVFYSNRSACYVGLEDYENVIKDTTEALKLKPDYSKCLLRRSNAYEQLGNLEECMFDLTALTVLGGFSSKSIEPALDRVLKKHSYNIVEKNINENKGVKTLPSPSSISSFFGAFNKDEPKDLGIEGEVEPNSGDFFLKSAIEHLNSSTEEGFEKADVEFEQAIKQYESNPSTSNNEKLSIAYEISGIFKFLKLDPITALSSIESSIKIFPRSRAYVFQALILADRREFDQAETLFEKAIKLNPNSSEIYYHRAQLYYLTNQLSKAKENFEKSKELNSKNIYSYIQLACIEYRENNYEEAKKLFQDAKHKFPTSPEIPNYYGEILGDKGDIENAIKQFEISYKLQESLFPVISIGVIPLVNKAALLSKNPTPENVLQSIEILEKAIDSDPKSELAKITLAQLKLQVDEVEDAIKLFEETSLLARNLDEKLQATSFAEASKVQLKVKNDPILSVKIKELVAQYGAQGLTNLG